MLLRLTERLTGHKPTGQNSVALLENGKTTYPAMVDAIHKDRHHIHMESYIFLPDGVGQAFVAALAAAAARGVQVRLLLDALGGMGTSRDFFARLEESGGRVEFFAPLRPPIFRSRANHRNHRKLIVVDGRKAFTGGLNIGREYLGLDPVLGPWRDTHMALEGPAAAYLQQVFMEDWYYTTGEMMELGAYTQSVEPAGDAMVQVIPSGPDLPWGAFQQSLVRAIASATTRVFIASPYFVPDRSTLDALVSASLAGVDVRLLVPSISDNRIVLWAGKSHYVELLAAGIKIFEYGPGFIHAKDILVDDWAASVGSANMDIRSFHLNYEVNCLVCNREFFGALKTIFERDMSAAHRVTIEECRNWSPATRMAVGFARALSPLL